MAEVFKWSPRINASVTHSFRVRKVQFGDGYSQVAADGINTQEQKWNLNFIGKEDYIREIKAFLELHGGVKSFIWQPPLEQKGLYRSEDVQIVALGGDNYSLTVVFYQSFSL